MIRHAEAVAKSRAELLRTSLVRHRLVFIQLGAAFNAIRTSIFDYLDGDTVDVSEFSKITVSGSSRPVVVVGLESLIAPNASKHELTMGTLRESVFAIVDSGRNVCLVSRAPRVAFSSVPGSSILEDAALVSIPFLTSDECPPEANKIAGWALPEFTFGKDQDLVKLFTQILQELGAGVLSALDHCLYEIDPRGPAGLNFMSHRDKEAARCAGILVVSNDGEWSLSVSNRLRELKTALADVISNATTPARDLASVFNGLWYIERTIRAAVRAKAIQLDGEKWRGTIVGGDLVKEVLSRARLDSSIGAVSLKELRDPLEWLNLGELLDIARSTRFGGLEVDPIIWRRFAEQVMPIRNRISHMRNLKSNDEEVVSMWVGVVRQQLG